MFLKLHHKKDAVSHRGFSEAKTPLEIDNKSWIARKSELMIKLLFPS